MKARSEVDTFGRVLVRFRSAAGLSQEELADRAGLSRRGISDLERGRRRSPYPATIRRLVDALALDELDRAELLLAARAAPRHSLPVAVSSFVGRRDEVAELRRQIHHHRLVTLTGSGGVGKTRLALRVAEQEVRAFANGVWFVDLAPLLDPALVPQTVSRALGLPEDDRPHVAIALARAMRSLHGLLIVDNCEHLVHPCAVLVEHLLQACPRLSILATSRQALGVTGEQIWTVPPMPVGDVDSRVLPHADAILLFADRARLVQPGFALDADNIRIVQAVCRQLDGIPLAIELAAARLGVIGLDQLAARLDRPLGLLSGAGRRGPPRHETLRATIDWSCALLDERERQLFTRLSVFPANWDLPAAEVVCTGTGISQHDVLPLLDGLIRKSLVTVQPQTKCAYRYRVLESLRQYGLEHLTRAGDAAAFGSQHASYYLDIRRRAESDAGGIANSPHILLENDNIRAALRWAVDNGRARMYRAARVLVIDHRGRILLLRYQGELPIDPEHPAVQSFWVTPGGVVEPGESLKEAARRELAEETGIRDVALMYSSRFTSRAYFWQGEPALREDHYFVARVKDAQVDLTGLPLAERSTHPDFRWWNLTELQVTRELLWPTGAVDLIIAELTQL